MTDEKTSRTSPCIFSTPRARTCAKERNLDYKVISGSGPDGMILERDVLQVTAAHVPRLSPLAKKLAKLYHIDPESAAGTGFHGKIMADDIRNMSADAAREATAPTSPKKEIPGGIQTEIPKEIPLTGMRKIIADKMLDSLHTLAQANHRITVDMSQAVQMREQLKACGLKISYNDLVIRCAAKALTEHPMMNATMGKTSIILQEDVNVGIAVATETGLLVPVIQHTDRKSLCEIAETSKDLAARTKTGRLTPDEMSHGTFTVTNLGMYDIESFTAIINKPEAGILAVGKMEKKPVVRNDEIVIRPLMQLSLTYDHRIVDGAPAALFLRRIKQLLENPGLLL